MVWESRFFDLDQVYLGSLVLEEWVSGSPPAVWVYDPGLNCSLTFIGCFRVYRKEKGEIMNDDMHVLEDPEDEDESGPFWCLHCEKGVVDVSLSPSGRDYFCPFCGAYGPRDLWPWNYVRSCVPDLPEVPEHGKHYP